MKYLFQSISHIIHLRFSDIGSKLDSVHLKSNLKTDEVGNGILL